MNAVYTLDVGVETEPDDPGPRPRPPASGGVGGPIERAAERVAASVDELLDAILTPKQAEWVRLRAGGMTDAAIARHLHLSRPSVFGRGAAARERFAIDPRAAELRALVADGERLTYAGAAWNSAGEVQIGPRSGPADPERLRHLPIGGLSQVEALRNGWSVVAETSKHKTGWHTCGVRSGGGRVRPGSQETDDGIPPGSGGNRPPDELLAACDPAFADADDRIEQDRRRPLRRIAHPVTESDRLANAVADLAPVERLAVYRTLRPVAPGTRGPALTLRARGERPYLATATDEVR